ncbi:unnamed protein product, partial [Mesorhabditis spiculigera]
MSMSFLLTSQPQFQYWARCIELGYQEFPDMNDTVCTLDLADDDRFGMELQKDIAHMRTWIQVANSIPNLISAPLLGIWADRAGRKPALIFSICGFCIYAVLYVIATFTYRHINVYIWFFAAETIWGATGGSCGLIGTMFAMIIDETRKDTGTKNYSVPVRIIVGAALQNFGGFAGNIVITILAGLESRYLICALLQCACIFATFFYVLLFVRETHHPNRVGEYGPDFGVASTSSSSDPSITTTRSTANLVVLGWQHFVGLYRSMQEVLFRKRRGWIRFCVITSLALSAVELIVLDINYIYLYIKLPAFHWSDSLFSLFMTVKGLAAATGMLLGPLVLARLQILGKDSLYIILGCTGAATSFYMLAFAPNTATVFSTAFVFFLVGFLYPGSRSFVPRLVEQHETARLFSILGVVMVICPVISGIVFNSLYRETLDWWPGFSFLIAAVFATLATFGQCAMHWLMRPLWLEEYEAVQKEKADTKTDA